LLYSPSQYLRDRTLVPLRREVENSEGDGWTISHAVARSVDWNAASAVLRIVHKNKSIMLAGDANAETWRDILGRSHHLDITSDVVIAWHHGGRLGAGEDEGVWARVLGSGKEGKYVLISHGCNNAYGHPHVETLRAVRGSNGAIFCTEHARREAPMSTEAFREITVAVAGLMRGTPRTYRATGDDCCGHIRVVIDENGGLRVDTSVSHIGRASRESCCLFPPA
jgi:hypothetical protein